MIEAERPAATPDEGSARWWTVLAGLGGFLLVAVQRSVGGSQFTALLGVQGPDAFYYRPGLVLPLVPIMATVAGLLLLRWWPYLLAAGALLTALDLAPLPVPDEHALTLYFLFGATFPLLAVGLLGAAQSLLGGAPAAGAAVAGLAAGAALFGRALIGDVWSATPPSSNGWKIGLLALGIAALAPALWWCRRGDRAAAGPPDVKPWAWRRLRLVLAAGGTLVVALMVALVTTGRLGQWLGVDWMTLVRYPYAKAAIAGAVTLVLAAVFAALAGLWSLAGAFSVVTVQVAIAAPVTLALQALGAAGPVRWLGALAGLALGAAAAASRWRIAAAVTLSVGAATALFIAYAATSGDPAKLAVQQRVVPALVLLVLAGAAAAAVVGATAPVLAPRGAVPAVLGPIAGVLTTAGIQTVPVVGGRDGLRTTGNSFAPDLTTSAVLLLVAAAAIGGLGIAHYLVERWAERKRAEQIRREAAAAERDRLARPIHDGVLQVLALVQRQGADLGGSGAQLAALAGEQEAALRNLLSGAERSRGRAAEADLRAVLTAFCAPAVEVSTPAVPVLLPAAAAAELTAAVRAALDNVRRHAGPGARTWLLLEDESDGVRVTVRDDGAGFDPRRLDEAARAGRLGVAQSMRGRISDLGGTTTIHSRPGDGTEVEFWVPRR